MDNHSAAASTAPFASAASPGTLPLPVLATPGLPGTLPALAQETLLAALGGDAPIAPGDVAERALFDELYLLAPVGCFLLGPDGSIERANLVGADLLDIDRAQPGRARLRSFVAARFLPDFDLFLAAARRSTAPVHCALQLQRGRGDRGLPVTLHGCLVQGALRVTVEPAEGRLPALEKSEERFRRIVQTAREGIWEFDDAAHTTFVNPRMAEMLGYDIDEMPGLSLVSFMDGEGRALLERNVARGQQGMPGRREFKLVRKDGAALWVHLAVNPLHDEDGAYLGALALVSDITEQRTAHRESADLAWQQANFDVLTGLPNRNLFQERLRHEMKKAQRGRAFLALLFIDLDRFKQVNDRYGHQQGDALLVQVAQRLGACMRATDTLARIGGDEFVAILPELGHVGDAERVARDVIAVLQRPFELAGGNQGHISGSVGIALYPSDAADAEELLRNADQAMYAAKNGGRNRFTYFTEDMQAAAQGRLQLADELRRAAAEHEFTLHYQPIVHLQTGAIERAEALLRWHHPQRGVLNPADFIAGAESTGLLLEIGDRAFRQAADQVLAWQAALGRPFQVSINVSSAQLRDESHGWLRYVESLHLPPKSLVADVPEDLLAEPAAHVLERLRRLHSLGVQVALDDFGTGHSALAQLQQFDIDYLKIDSSFVAGLEAAGAAGADGSDLAMCEAIIVLAHKLGLEVVAEGVETPAQLALLRQAGCDYAQGYVFARPVPADQLLALAREGGEGTLLGAGRTLLSAGPAATPPVPG
ncbi:PAS domain S-box-containing protein/diguanylate cyclase (GGDEF)-like protein [Pseudoduganella lurida]|uniref:PAS domain S-box-containing protein/diguanylate cyclase (GGDEF)-like protein n=1 Tax=Pseudoduganella lurida TaxID=1036180 RepID=A0A562REX0_9BURK|nr:EAL domain-containing protein [Pseudoduganella lurida]TWI67617.1 PAS domain S-box-containing protein/diguanylate cyclase (GGDEF)-like protein [Pseudoduganella lurida]